MQGGIQIDHVTRFARFVPDCVLCAVFATKVPAEPTSGKILSTRRENVVAIYWRNAPRRLLNSFYLSLQSFVVLKSSIYLARSLAKQSRINDGIGNEP